MYVRIGKWFLLYDYIIFFFLFPYLFYLFFWSCCSHFLHNHYFSRLKCSSSFSSFNKYETDWFFPVIGLDIRSFHFFAFLPCPLHFKHTTVLVTSIARPKWYRSAGESAHPLLLCPCVTLSVRHSVRVPLCPCVTLSVCYSVRVLLCPCVTLSVCHSVLVSVVSLSASRSVRPSICVSLRPYDSLFLANLSRCLSFHVSRGFSM